MEFAIYLLGVVLFSAFYYQIKSALGSEVLFFIAVVAYLALVRVVGYSVRRYVRSRA